MPTQITQEDLQKFRAWLLRRGRGDETARCYCVWVKKCGETPSITDRLLNRKLSPKTRHANKAALTAWAKFTKDAELTSDLDDIRLPPPVRVTAKTELDTDEWRDVIVQLERVTMPEPIRQTLLLVSKRGLRMGDALRLERTDIESAVKTGILSFEAKGGRRLEYEANQIMEHLKAILSFMKAEKVTRVRDLILPEDSADRTVNNKVGKALKRAAKKARVKGVHPHRMRRTYATHFVKRLQNDPRAMIKLMKHMGWTNINTAAQYVDNVSGSDLDKVGSDMMAELLEK